LTSSFDWRASGKWTALSIVVGVIAGLGGIGFQVVGQSVSYFTLERIAGYHPGEEAGEISLYPHAVADFRPWMILPVIALGGLVSGWIVYTFAPEAEGHGTDAAIDAQITKDATTPESRHAYVITVTPETSAGAAAPTKEQGDAAKTKADGLLADLKAGKTWEEVVAASGDATAAYEIALRFAEGRGVPVNFEEAARWYERAASKGLAPAQFRYATLLEKGQGVKKDLGQARRLYLAAAARGNAKAMHNLAVLYAEGIEGRPDYNTAAQWFRKAARHGVGDSQYNLGVLYARGLGTEKNLAESYKWFALAEAQGDKEAARKRDEVAGQLDGQALAAAEQAVKTFRPEPQPHEATTVAVPPGGWDEAVSAPTAHGKARTTGRPLSLGAYTSGKR
jgi:localization factor PodJL